MLKKLIQFYNFCVTKKYRKSIDKAPKKQNQTNENIK